MLEIVRTNSDNKDFIYLVKFLDAELASIDGRDHSFYNQFNKIDSLKHVIVAYHNKKPVGCGAVKEFDQDTAEIKRMYVSTELRGKGVATKILSELEKWALELSYSKCILETGIKHPDAVALYKKCGYKVIPNYGQYINMEKSICFEKIISK